MAVAIARFTLEGPCVRILAPFLLLEPRTALVTLDTASVMLALTGQNSGRRSWIQNVTCVGVTVAHTTSSNRDIFN